MKAHLPETGNKRIVIIGAGFGGLKLARELTRQHDYQVVLIDKHNYHQFQPLLYQVATAGIEASAISFPIRKAFQKQNNIHVRIATVQSVDTLNKRLWSNIGVINFDYLVIATGAVTNFFGMEHVKYFSMPMKTVTEAMELRNKILENYEKAIATEDKNELVALMTLVIVGGGPTGVELAGAIAEMKNFVLPKDYPELDFKLMRIVLIESNDRLIKTMSNSASKKALQYLRKLGVEIVCSTRVTDYDGHIVETNKGEKILSNTLIWTSGVQGCVPDGMESYLSGASNRILVDEYNRVIGLKDVFVIGDAAHMTEKNFPYGHPQVAQVAIQQAKNLAGNFKRDFYGYTWKPFHYKNLGSMATVGRNLAVVDLPFIRFQGFIAWLFWMFIHLFAIVGVKNRLMIFINWFWNYFTYDQSLRIIFKSKS